MQQTRIRRAGGSIAFTVTVTVVVILGALAMAAVLVASGAPRALALGVILAALPVGPVIACYLWLDRYEPEPRGLLLLGLGWGAFVATTAALFLQAFDAFAFGGTEAHQAIVVAPLTEELAKGLFILLLLLFRRAELDGVLDGIVYAGMVGVGFAFTENILYLASAYIGQDDAPGGLADAVTLFVVRGVFSPFAHPFFTAFVGIGIGIAVTSRRRATRIIAPLVGYVLAVGAHGVWNAALMIDGGSGALASYFLVMVPAFLLMVAFAIWARRREGVLLAASLTDCARRGFLQPAEVPWLSRLPARRVSRRHAQQVGGVEALEAMKAYQTEAVELGFLHHRYLRGTPPAYYGDLGQEHVRRMFELRPSLIWPPSPSQPTGVHP